MKQVTRLSMVFGAALCALAASPSMAGEGADLPPAGPRMEQRRPMPMGAHGLAHGLNLSEEQQDKVFAIMHAQAPQRREQEKAARKAQEALRALVDSDKFDDAKAAALAQAEGKAVAALALLRARTDAQVQALLTPEQRKQPRFDGPRREPRQ